MGCPLSEISTCPLYIESHNAAGLGCVDDMSKVCLVARGKMNFQNQIWLLASKGIAHPGMLQLINTVGRH
jgi:hypothetical protein